MSNYCIVLGEGVRVSPKAYLAALRLAMDNPTAKWRESFQDPRGYSGPYTGAEIVRQYRRMIADRWAERTMSQHAIGKGSKAQKRVRHFNNLRAKCKWCGQRTGNVAKRFCEASCARAYNS